MAKNFNSSALPEHCYDCGVMQTPTSIFRDAEHRNLIGQDTPTRRSSDLPWFRAGSSAGFDLDEFYEVEAADSAEYEVEADYGEEL